MHFFASNIRWLRMQRKWSGQDMADYLGRKRSTYSYWENGGSECDIATLIKLADFHRVSLDLLLRTDLAKMPLSLLEQHQRGYKPS